MNANPILVAGAGAAGLVASLAAAMEGRDVVLVERSQHFQSGSNSAMSTAMIPAGGSRWQREAGVADSPELFASDISRATHGSADHELTHALTRLAPELVAWLADECSLPLALVTDFSYPGHSATRCHSLPDRSGRTMLRYLFDAAEKQELITFLSPCELAEVRESPGGLAARLQTPDGVSEWAIVSSVILATNGFGANPELVKRYIPEMATAYYHGGDGSRGDALHMGAALGADLAFLDAYQGHGSVAMPQAVLLTWAVMMHGGIMVNALGKRFGNEASSYSAFGAHVADQPDGIGWAVFDTRIGELCESFADYQDIVTSKAIHRAHDTRELADLIGCDERALSITLRRVENARAGQETDPYGRTDFGNPLIPPLLAVRVTGALFHTQGGLAVDGQGRVLRKGSPIPGIYAAGGAAAGVSGHGSAGYLAGNGLLAALGLGYLAGRSAATQK